jgi:hypothetical protein
VIIPNKTNGHGRFCRKGGEVSFVGQESDVAAASSPSPPRPRSAASNELASALQGRGDAPQVGPVQELIHLTYSTNLQISKVIPEAWGKSVN